MNINQELVEKLRNGEIMAINNGSLEDLHSVLNAASEEHETRGHSKYYGFEEGVWYGDNKTDLPTIPLSDFFLPTQKIIPVEELEAVVNEINNRIDMLIDNSRAYIHDNRNDLAEILINKAKQIEVVRNDLQTLINKYK